MDVPYDLIQKVVTFKRFFDSSAELGWNEWKTSAFIQKVLGQHVFWHKKTALVYALGEGAPIFFRAELDGLNTSKGVKHVCGHSAHMAALMGAYLYFLNHAPNKTKIYFIFQPCEEGYPSGASFISEQFKPLSSCLFGAALHAYPSNTPGELIEPVMAGGDYFSVKVSGKETHIKNKYTNQKNDVILALAKLTTAINESVFEHALINAGVFSAGSTPNSIAGSGIVSGDVRYLNALERDAVFGFFQREVLNIQQQFPKLGITKEYHKVYPILKNDKRLMKKMRQLFSIQDVTKTFATEDFSLYPVPLLFFLFGTGEHVDLHEANFTVSDTVLVKMLEFWLKLGTHAQSLVKA